MPREIEELVEFLHHGNTQIRQVAVQHLVPFSESDPLIFKQNHLEPLRDLKLLLRDYPQIATDVINIITNLTAHDAECLEAFSRDDQFTENLLSKIIDDIAESNADACCGLLANLVKDDTFAKRLVDATRAVPPEKAVKIRLKTTAKGEVEAEKVNEPVSIRITTSGRVLDQLMDVFVKGANKSLNPKADYDYLSYVFADLSKFEQGRGYLLTQQKYDGVVPITKLVVFTEHGSLTRRKGIASTIKNCAFEVEKHDYLMRDEAEGGVGLLPYIMLPLAGNEEFDADDSDGMLVELQLLPPDKQREADDDIVATHLETLLLLTSKREGRDRMRDVKVYPVIRELHLKKENENVTEGCVRLVNVIMRDEEYESKTEKIKEITDEDDHKIEEVF